MPIYIDQAYNMLDEGIFVSRFRENSSLGNTYHKIIKDGEEYQIIACNRETGEETVTWRYPLNQLARLLREHYIELHTWTYEPTSWKAIEAQSKIDLETIQTDKDAYAFIEKYLSKELRHQYITIYQSDRHEMNRTPREAIDNLLSLPPL
jgi:peptidoglycan/xylan/chitin deacetylase (PgdA/CDA1 family)